MTIRKAEVTDLELTYTLCRQSYAENFATHWKPSGLEWYFEKVYSRNGIETELNSPDINYFIAFVDSIPVGYTKINFTSALKEFPAAETVEIEKIYFLPTYQRKGLGTKLISLAVEVARGLAKKWIWLGVLTSNEKARIFYSNLGFTVYDKITLPFSLLKEEHRDMWRMKMKL